MPIIDFRGAAIYYESSGTGHPIVLIPGFASGIWNWSWQADLASEFQVITFDPRGIGRSISGDLSSLSLDLFTDDVLLILDDLDIEKAHIVGASFGGFVALEFALKQPERVDKLILACTSAGGPEHVSPDIEILRSFTRDPNIALGEQIRRFFRPAFTERFHEEHPEIVEALCRAREANDVSDETYLAQLTTAVSFNVADRLHEIEHKTLVLTGDSDKLVPMQNSVNLAAKLPNARLEIIENGSHMFFVERAEIFNKTVSNFLSGR